MIPILLANPARTFVLSMASGKNVFTTEHGPLPSVCSYHPPVLRVFGMQAID